jgi:magnesium-transporting ATPase (P-type)
MVVLMYAGPVMFDIDYEYINTPYYLSSNISIIDGEVTNRTVHYTFLFNTFMMMNIFNQINCRKLGLKDFNVFERIYNNLLFIIIVGGEFVAQWAMVSFGGKLFRTTPLPFSMVLASVLFGAGSLLVSVILKATPENFAEKFKIELDENGLQEGQDIISKVHKKIKGSLERSETERLLDSK